MRLSCSVCVANRILPALSIRPNQKHVNSTLVLARNPNSSAYCLIHFSSQCKTGKKYDVKSISKILSRFLNEGKATIQFREPQHDLYIKADPLLLKNFLHLLKRILENKMSDNEIPCSSMSVIPTTKPLPKKLVIERSSDYPTKGLPRTLETLHIYNLKLCTLNRSILQLKRLKCLDLSNNCIKNLPTEISYLPNLAELVVGSNELGKSHPREWTWLGGNLSKTLKLLDLSRNNLLQLPDQIVKLHSLVTLKIDNNNLKTLPSGVGSMRNLKVVTASNNFMFILPGSVKNWRLEKLDLSNNRFHENIIDGAIPLLPNLVPVGLLKEYAGRRVLQLQMMYSAQNLPATLVNYLDFAKYCICGNACFETYLKQIQTFSLHLVAQTVSMSLEEEAYVPLECYFCSTRCYRIVCYLLMRHPIT